MGLTLIGKDGPASAIGAKITITAGTLKQVKINQWATTYLSYNDPRLHIGLGKNDFVNRLDIRWPDGEEEHFEQLEVDHYITISQGKGIHN